MRDSLPCVNTSRNEKGIGRIGIGIQVCSGIVNWKDLLYGVATECVHTGCTGVKEECLPRERNRSINCMSLIDVPDNRLKNLLAMISSPLETSNELSPRSGKKKRCSPPFKSILISDIPNRSLFGQRNGQKSPHSTIRKYLPWRHMDPSTHFQRPNHFQGTLWDRRSRRLFQ